MDCIFCKIIKKEVVSEVVFEDEIFVAFKTIAPMAPVHVLIVPKKHIVSVDKLEDSDLELAGKLILTARNLARDLNVSEKGYKLIFHTGKHGEQEIEHLHLHLLGGAKMKEEIKIIEE
ncbi:MAG: histidine triad nucleotide-binding protein [Parcubacteria group bacterium]|jgi:histidine triad (HIT) family protein